MQLKVNLRDKIKKLGIKDLEIILDEIKGNKDNNEKYDDIIINYLKDKLCVECSNEDYILESLNIFFVDTLELVLNLLKEKNFNKKIVINEKILETILGNIKNKNCSTIVREDYDVCVALISRSVLIFDKNEDKFMNSNFPQMFIIDNFKNINDLIIDLLGRYTSIFYNKFIGKSKNHRDGRTGINDILLDVLSWKNMNKSLWKGFLKNPEKKYKVLYYKHLIRYAFPVTVTITIASLVANSYVKYKNMLENKEYLVIFKIALLIYENEYKMNIMGDLENEANIQKDNF